MTRTRLIIPPGEWPERDRLAWAALFTKGGIFDSAGVGASWSEGTRRKFEQSYGHWLGYLQRVGQLETAPSPASRLTPATVRAFGEETERRVSPISTSSQLNDLFLIARAMDPVRDWDWFRQIADRFRRLPAHRQLKPRPGVSSADVYAWARAEIEAADRMTDDGSWRRSIRFRDGLMVGLLIARPLRLRSFLGIELGRHLFERDGQYRLQFAPGDMKDRKSRDFSLPAELVEPMHRYLTEFRPRLLGDNCTDRLWVSRRQGALSYDGFQRHIQNVTQRAFDETYGPHAFRHIAATSIAEEDPVHVNIIASLLGHATLTMSERHYNRANGVKAAAAYQELIGDRRRQARRNDRMRRAIQDHDAGVADLPKEVEE